ncbi:2-dehydro-3-deoxyglucarate aldolase/4-hydroxy-2-oxoheptanedioate aldolase [Burkholderia sp. GAS332]|nr:2-dehydro-3-deoxyglucarate aldolase/4-hydroxy-2-oxoheptanedioate aldolase [Burkholderia sp. GAS332]
MQVTNLFKQRLDNKELQVGTWLMSGSATCAEAIGWTGIDFVVVDMEHSPLDLGDVVEIQRAISGTPAGCVTRIPTNDPVVVKRVLDAGAQTLMFPMIEGADDAAQAIRSMRYPPAGIRGVAGVQRASRYGAVQNYLKICQSNLAAIVQVETANTFVELDQIASVEGVDAIFVGPNDLAASLGRLGDVLHPEVQDMMKLAVKVCHKRGRPIGTVAGTTEAAQRYVDCGYDFVAIGSDLTAITGTVKEHLVAFGRSDRSNGPLPGHTGY